MALIIFLCMFSSFSNVKYIHASDESNANIVTPNVISAEFVSNQPLSIPAPHCTDYKDVPHLKGFYAKFTFAFYCSSLYLNKSKFLLYNRETLNSKLPVVKRHIFLCVFRN